MYKNLARDREYTTAAVHLFAVVSQQSFVKLSVDPDVPLIHRRLVREDAEARWSNTHGTKLITDTSFIGWRRIDLDSVGVLHIMIVSTHNEYKVFLAIVCLEESTDDLM